MIFLVIIAKECVSIIWLTDSAGQIYFPATGISDYRISSTNVCTVYSRTVEIYPIFCQR